MSQFVGGNLCWRFLRKFTFGGFYFGDFLHLQELGVARVNNQLLLADFILAIYLSTANPPTLIPRQQIDSYGIHCCVMDFKHKLSIHVQMHVHITHVHVNETNYVHVHMYV